MALNDKKTQLVMNDKDALIGTLRSDIEDWKSKMND